jgi:hypothetical protein
MSPDLEVALCFNASGVIKALEEKLKLSNDLARNLFQDTKKYLYIRERYKYKGRVPTKLLDVGWQTFIVHTHDYEAFCKDAFGYFVHYMPSTDAFVGITRDEEAMAKVLPHAYMRFGRELSQNWGVVPKGK